jgi:predicted nucleic acid-binding protein
LILYLDASALVKRYIAEKGSDLVNSWIGEADMVVTSILTRVEVVAAITRAQRMKIITPEDAQLAIRQFRAEWESYQRLPITESTVSRGDKLAWEHGLRGYDATHLASLLLWQEAIGQPVTLAAFDSQLLNAAMDEGLRTLP